MRISKTQLALAGIGVAALIGATTAGTMALFTGQATIGANAFNTGIVSLTTTPSTALVTYANMMPGDSTTQQVLVTNTGQAMRYAISSTATNTDTKALKDQLVLTVKTVDVTTPGVPCDNFDGTQLYTGDLDSTAGKIVGDNTTGAQAGDRTLAAAATEYLCFQVSLPLSTSNSFVSAATTATFTFDAEQTKNN